MGAPSSNLGSATLNKVRLGLTVRIWAKRASGKSPVPKKGSGHAGTLLPMSLRLALLLPSCRPGTLKPGTHKHKLTHTQAPLLKYMYTHTQSSFEAAHPTTTLIKRICPTVGSVGSRPVPPPPAVTGPKHCAEVTDLQAPPNSRTCQRPWAPSLSRVPNHSSPPVRAPESP